MARPLFFLHKSGTIMLRRAREVEATAIHALLWAAKDAIPLVEAFHTERYRKWVEDRCNEKLVWVVVKQATTIGAMVMQGNEVFHLVVSPEHQRNGVARTLVEKAKAVCKEHGVTARQSRADKYSRSKASHCRGFPTRRDHSGAARKHNGKLDRLLVESSLIHGGCAHGAKLLRRCQPHMCQLLS